MGERGGSEFDELENLLREIPNVSSGKPNFEESLLCEFSKDFKPFYDNSLSLIEKHHNNRTMDDRKMPVNTIIQSPKSLTSAFSALSFGNGGAVCVDNPTNSVYNSVTNHTSVLDEKYRQTLKKPSPIIDPRIRVVPSSQSPNNPSNGLRNGTKGFRFSPDMPVPLMADHQQYFVEAHSQLQYFDSRQLNLPHISWNRLEEEQYLCWQQLQNRGFEALPPIQANENLPARLISRSPIQPYYGVPASNHRESCYQKSHWNNFAVSKGLDQSDHVISSPNYHAPDILDKVGRQVFPEKILTRLNGLNSIRSAKFGSVGGNESCINRNQRSLSNGNCSQSLPGRNLILDSLKLQKYDCLDEGCGKICLMAKDQNGCRYLQRKFTEGTREDIEKIFLEIIDHIAELMTDPFGNYLVQKLLEVCDEDQRMQILRAITRKAGDLVKISCDIHGTRAVQKVIETLKTPEQFSMVVSSLKPGIVALIKNMNGNHVAQRCLQYWMPEYNKFLFEAATTNCVELATDRHGCCVLQKCLGCSDGEQTHRLISEITSNALILSQDPFGNYVVQFVFELEISWATTDILKQLQGKYGDLSVQKCSSNVVEKCLKYAREEHQLCIIQELIDNPRLDQIMQDPYGNYVIQAALSQSKGALHAALVEAIRPHIPVLRTSPYGKKVLSSYGLKK